MEIITLILLYYLSQKPEFAESVKPLMSQLKNSEQILSFLNDLSHFSEAFTGKNSVSQKQEQQPCNEEKKEQPKEKPQSPTSGIADEFIQQILEGYLSKK